MADIDELQRATTNVVACAHNAAVSHGTERGRRKMAGLIEAINLLYRVEGRERLRHLVEQGVIDRYEPCPPECCFRVGGLFHADGCENDPNSDVYLERQLRARERLPGGPDGMDGWRAACVTLVGDDTTIDQHYHRRMLTGIVRGLRS